MTRDHVFESTLLHRQYFQHARHFQGHGLGVATIDNETIRAIKRAFQFVGPLNGSDERAVLKEVLQHGGIGAGVGPHGGDFGVLSNRQHHGIRLLGAVGQVHDTVNRVVEILENLVGGLGIPLGVSGCASLNSSRRDVGVGQPARQAVFLIAKEGDAVPQLALSAGSSGGLAGFQGLTGKASGAELLKAVAEAVTNAADAGNELFTLDIGARQVIGIVSDDFSDAGDVIGLVSNRLGTATGTGVNRNQLHGLKRGAHHVISSRFYGFEFALKEHSLGAIEIDKLSH